MYCESETGEIYRFVSDVKLPKMKLPWKASDPLYSNALNRIERMTNPLSKYGSSFAGVGYVDSYYRN